MIWLTNLLYKTSKLRLNSITSVIEDFKLSWESTTVLKNIYTSLSILVNTFSDFTEQYFATLNS